MNGWDQGGSYIGYFIVLRFVCLLPGRHLLSVSPTVLLLVTNIAQSLARHHHLLSLPSVNHCLSADTLTSSTTESHQKRDQSEFNKQNQLCLTAWLLTDWELLKLKMWKWTVWNWNWRWGYLEGKVEGRSIIRTTIPSEKWFSEQDLPSQSLLFKVPLCYEIDYEITLEKRERNPPLKTGWLIKPHPRPAVSKSTIKAATITKNSVRKLRNLHITAFQATDETRRA